METCRHKSRLKLGIEAKRTVDSRARDSSHARPFDVNMSNLEIGMKQNFLLGIVLFKKFLSLALGNGGVKRVKHIYSSLSS
jgi:hypothetical protein